MESAIYLIYGTEGVDGLLIMDVHSFLAWQDYACMLHLLSTRLQVIHSSTWLGNPEAAASNDR